MSKVYKQVNAISGANGVVFGGGGGGGGGNSAARKRAQAQRDRIYGGGGLSDTQKKAACAVGAGAAVGLSFAPHPAAKVAGGALTLATTTYCL